MKEHFFLMGVFAIFKSQSVKKSFIHRNARIPSRGVLRNDVHRNDDEDDDDCIRGGEESGLKNVERHEEIWMNYWYLSI